MKITFKLTNFTYSPSTDTLYANVERCDDPGHDVDERYRIEFDSFRYTSSIRCMNETPGDAYLSYPARILFAFSLFFENLYESVNTEGNMAPDECLKVGMTFDFEA